MERSEAKPESADGGASDGRVPLRDHIRDILDSLPAGVLTVDRDWRVTSLNLAAQGLLGVTEAEALGRLCRKVMQTDGCIGECPLRITLETGRSVSDYEVTATGIEGRARRLAVNTAVLRGQGGSPIGGVVSFREITSPDETEVPHRGPDFHGMIGRSAPMRSLFSLIEEVADFDSTVLIQGESGTGKELVARAIQRLSPRRERAFIRVNCAAFVETLLESELFGHVKGAFTGAHRDRPGRFELADTGTIFLDEIGEASSAVQLRLLRVLQEQEFERVGGSETLRVDVRVVAATQRPLADLVREGRFREDLFYRLNVIPVNLPPLRERREDIPPLAEHFLRRQGVRCGRSVAGFSPRALGRLSEYSWPGNVRELENAVEHAWVRARGGLIRTSHLPAMVAGIGGQGGGAPGRGPGRPSTGTTVGGETGVRGLLRVLEAARWNRQEAARQLGVSRTTLWRRMVAAGLSDRSE